jgi:hypothetical protein
MSRIVPSIALVGAIAALVVPIATHAQSLSPSHDPGSVWIEIGGQANAAVGLKAWPDGKSYFMGGSMWGGNDVTTDGSFLVVNAGSSEVWHTGEYAEPIARWGQKGTGPGQFDFERDPATTDGLAFGGVAASPLGGPYGKVYVADPGNQRVQEFDHDGVFIRWWGGTGTEDGQFMDPIDVAVGATGLVYVVDDIRDDIQVFSTEGSFMAKIGGHGSGDGQLDVAGSVFVGPDGTLYAADSGNGRVEAWAPDGTFLWSFGSPGTADGQFDRPSDVGVDTARDIYVVDRHRLQILGPDRTHLATWAAPVTTDADALRSGVVGHDDYVYVDSPYGGQDSTLAYHLQVHWPQP